MLTKQDLSKIKKVVREEVVSESETGQKSLRAEIILSRMQLQDRLKNLNNRVIDLEQQSKETGKNVLGLKKDVKKIDKKTDDIIDLFEHDYLDLEKRTRRIENHLQLPTLADF
ncbi:MAG: hypothetical protein NTZ93_01375 [Candidatus Beckwithbacteria bacterium]|nr:hypothetical protein [Candidatus Beckwithbacteria bacterium]